MSDSHAPPSGSPVLLKASDLPAHCPNPKMPLWSNHPRVFIDVASTGEGWCPYCGTVYKLKAGEHAHHQTH